MVLCGILKIVLTGCDTLATPSERNQVESTGALSWLDHAARVL